MISKADFRGNNGNHGYPFQGLAAKVKDAVANNGYFGLQHVHILLVCKEPLLCACIPTCYVCVAYSGNVLVLFLSVR